MIWAAALPEITADRAADLLVQVGGFGFGPSRYRGYMGLYWDTGKDNGNCYLGFRVMVPL